MRKLTKLLAILLAVLMTVSVFPVSVFATDNVISAVDEDLVTETVFPTGKVTDPAFYETIPVKIGDSEKFTDVEVSDWLCVKSVDADDTVTEWDGETEVAYDGTAVGTTYYFSPVLPTNYTLADDVATTITAKVVDATFAYSGSSYALSSIDGSTIPVVLKKNPAKAGSTAYDATGLNAFMGWGTGLQYYAAAHSKRSGAVATSGTAKVTVTGGAQITSLFGGGYNVAHDGDVELDVYGSVTVSNKIYASGGGGTKGSVSGTTTLNIYDLDEDSAIKAIGEGSRGVGEFVIKLDDTSKHLISDGVIDNVTTSGNTSEKTKVYVNNELFKSVVDVTGIPKYLLKGTAEATLSTTFGEIPGFTWSGDDTAEGDEVFTLTAPEGYFFDGIVKTQEYTITIVDEVIPDVEIADVNTDGLVMETVFPNGEITEPTFYKTLAVTAGGEEVDLDGFTWKCENYDEAVEETYTFTAIPPAGYKWADTVTVPKITVKVADVVFTNNSGEGSSAYGISSVDGSVVPVVLKKNPDKDGSRAYDATGCNALMSWGTALKYISGAHSKRSGATTTSGTTKVTVTDGAIVKEVYGGGYKVAHDGNANIDITGLATITTVYGGGYGDEGTVSGTATVNIYNLDEDSTVTTITRGGATNLVVNLDDSSASLKDSIVFDYNTKLYINGMDCTPTDMKELNFEVTGDVSFKLYKTFNYETGATVPASATVTEDGVTTYTYIGLLPGNYCYLIKGDGYYTIKKNVWYSDAKAADDYTIEVKADEIAGDGFERATQMHYLYTDEVMETLLPSTTTTWEGYEHIFNTPFFTNPRKAVHQSTTQTEFEEFIKELDEEANNMYTFWYEDFSPAYGFDFPVVLLSNEDLSSATTIEEAAELLANSEKPMVQYQAQIHGGESASGEGALAMIGSIARGEFGKDGKDILAYVNILCIPRINLDGTKDNSRPNVADNINMNRDFLRLATKEIQQLRYINNLFMPEVLIDGHERDVEAIATTSSITDVQICNPGNLMVYSDVRELLPDMLQEAYDDIWAAGLRASIYSGGTAGAPGAMTGRSFYTMNNTLSFLIETHNYFAGLSTFERRIMGQYVTTESVLNFTAENADAIKQAVADARADVIAKGETYEEDDLVIIDQEGSGAELVATWTIPVYNMTDGSYNKNTTVKVEAHDTINASRPRPTAYVIPAGETFTQDVIDLMGNQGIYYYFIDANSKVLLQQYKGDENAAELLDETTVTFANGAYVIPMNQVLGNTIAMTMEPDIVGSRGYDGTLLQSGLVEPNSDGTIPIYRYCYDLVDGKIKLVEPEIVYADYTAVEEARAKVPADLTIYTDETAQAVTDAVNAVVYDLKADQQETVDGYAKAIEDALSKLELKPVAEAIVLTESMVNYRLRCTTAVVDGNLVLTADPAGTSSMRVRLGNLPEGATVAMVGTNANASMSSGIITVTNPGMKNVNVPMTITSAEGIVTEFVLVADFNNAIRYATYARLSQTGNNITVTSGAATAYVLFDTTEIDGGYVEVENVSRNLLGRYVISGSAVRFYNPVYDEGTATVNVKNANGETVETYNVTVTFADATEYTAVLDTSLRCTYEVDGDNITVTANAGVSNVYLNFGRYYSESLSASVNNDIIKKMGARSWRIMACDEPVEFDLYFDATTYDAEKVTRHVTVSF